MMIPVSASRATAKIFIIEGCFTNFMIRYYIKYHLKLLRYWLKLLGRSKHFSLPMAKNPDKKLLAWAKTLSYVQRRSRARN